MGDDERNVVDIDDDEEETGAASEAPSSASPSRIIKILFYIVGAVILVLLIIGISYIVTKNVQEQKYVREQAIIVAPPPPPLAHFDLPSFSVTTRDAEPHFIKITIALGYEDSIELNAELLRRTAQFQHIINVLLSGKRFEDVDTVEDKINLSEEIKAHINMILMSGKIKEVYFREIVIN
ncbi:MAG: flagellar basal body-associated FliL family protein [Spirochaetes bacterium]|nr:flagellar basal body-associated FliL family protein [Spirochaetota bacterium]